MCTSSRISTTLLFLGICIAQAWGSATLVPPSTEAPVSTSTSTSSTASVTGTNTSTTTGTTTGTITGTGTGTVNTTQTSTSTTTAQFPSLSGVSSCVSDCLATAIARVNCSSIVDVNCFCVQQNFPAELVACVNADCSDSLSSSETLAQQFCALASTSPTLTFAPVATTTTSTSTTSSSSTSTGTSTSTAPANTTTASSAGSLQVHGESALLSLVALVAFVGL